MVCNMTAKPLVFQLREHRPRKLLCKRGVLKSTAKKTKLLNTLGETVGKSRCLWRTLFMSLLWTMNESSRKNGGELCCWQELMSILCTFGKVSETFYWKKNIGLITISWTEHNMRARRVQQTPTVLRADGIMDWFSLPSFFSFNKSNIFLEFCFLHLMFTPKFVSRFQPHYQRPHSNVWRTLRGRLGTANVSQLNSSRPPALDRQQNKQEDKQTNLLHTHTAYASTSSSKCSKETCKSPCRQPMKVTWNAEGFQMARNSCWELGANWKVCLQGRRRQS